MINHTVFHVEEIVVHLYSTTLDVATILEEARRRPGFPLIGVYSFRKDQPLGIHGQYHVHVFEKNKQLFAINWDGTAHDNSHGKVIPAKVFDALRDRFPDLILPANRIIESISPHLAQRIRLPEGYALTAEDLLDLKTFIADELDGFATINLEPRSKVRFLAGVVPFVGHAFLLTAAEYEPTGELMCEAHLFWFPENVAPLASFHLKAGRDQLSQQGSGIPYVNIDFMLNSGKYWATQIVSQKIYEAWAARNWALQLPRFDFVEANVQELIKIWAFGQVRAALPAIQETTRLESLKAYISPVIKITPFEIE